MKRPVLLNLKRRSLLAWYRYEEKQGRVSRPRGAAAGWLKAAGESRVGWFCRESRVREHKRCMAAARQWRLIAERAE